MILILEELTNLALWCGPRMRVRLRLLGAPGWNLETGPISNEEEGGKRIYILRFRAPK